MKKLLLIMVVLVMCSSCGSNAVVSTTQTTNGAEAIQQVQSYKIGDECFVKNNDGEYKVTITGIEETADRNEFSDTQAERVVIISYAYENISNTKDIYISEMNFKSYDAEGNALESYPANVKYPKNIGAGRKCDAQIAYALNNDTNHIEMEFYDNMFNSKADCMFILEW